MLAKTAFLTSLDLRWGKEQNSPVTVRLKNQTFLLLIFPNSITKASQWRTTEINVLRDNIIITGSTYTWVLPCARHKFKRLSYNNSLNAYNKFIGGYYYYHSLLIGKLGHRKFEFLALCHRTWEIKLRFEPRSTRANISALNDYATPLYIRERESLL